MSSDPIEVLRRMRNEWPLATDEGPALDAAIASLSAPKPSGEWVMVPRAPTQAMIEAGAAEADGTTDIWDAMLAAAPKPDAWSRIHETPEYAAALAEVDAQIAGKPESAEAVVYCQMNWTPKGLHKHEWTCRHCGQKVRRNSADGHPHIPCAAPPRPEASAPVGVEAIADKIENDRTYWRSEAVADLRALAQQPAAVDEATQRDAERYRYLRRPEAWKEDHIAERGASAIFIGDGRRGEAKDGEALDAAIDRILAGQQQGGEA